VSALVITQADRDLVYSLCSPAATGKMEILALDYIKCGKGDDSQAVQMVAAYRKAATAELLRCLEVAMETLANEGVCGPDCMSCADAKAAIAKADQLKETT